MDDHPEGMKKRGREEIPIAIVQRRMITEPDNFHQKPDERNRNETETFPSAVEILGRDRRHRQPDRH